MPGPPDDKPPADRRSVVGHPRAAGEPPAPQGAVEGWHYATGQYVRVTWDSGEIRTVSELAPAARSSTDERQAWICPGLCDLQVNGYGGINFTSDQLTVAEVIQVARQLATHGTTRFLATLTTAASEVYDQAIRVLAEARRSGPPWLTAMLVGIHLEGPYISSEDGPRGAHPRAHCRPPDRQELDRWQELADGAIRLITLAPELPGAVELIRHARQLGMVAALGHLQANTAQLEAAMEAGAGLSTHLGNGAHATLPRHPNYLWDQLADDRLSASLIIDGHHLPAAVVRTILRTKGMQRCLLVSDLTMLAGVTPGRYSSTALGSVDVLADGRLVVADAPQYLAGASRHLVENVELLSQLDELSWPSAWEMASNTPARLLGLPTCDVLPGHPVHLTLVEHPAVDESPPPCQLPAPTPWPALDRWPAPCRWQVRQAWIDGWSPG